MKRYNGRIEGEQRIVNVDGKPLAKRYGSEPRRNVDFEWGTDPASPGAIHLATAILADHETGNSALAMQFANTIIAELPEQWSFGSDEVEKWVRLQSGDGVVRVPTDFPSFPNRLKDFQERIQPDELAKRGYPRPDDVRVSRSADSTGEEAYYVYLVFPDRTPEKALAWEKIEPMVSWVQNLIWTETGAQLWPYVRVKRHKELAGSLS
jgi:hypothetical protein